MTTLTVLAVTVFVLALLAIAANFVLYPSLLAIWPTRPRSTTDQPAVLPTVSMIIAVRNGGELIAAKLENALAVDYPRHRLQIVLFSDGSTDDTVAIAQAVAAQHPQVHVGHASEHRGKHLALVDAVAQATGDLLLFTDADAMLEPDAVQRLVGHFAAPEIGGVCGLRVLGELGAYHGEAQSGYVSADSRIKSWESRSGSITSNDGKLYCIRHSLFTPVPPAVTDDLFQCLTVVRQGKRFVFEPAARAFVRTPSRNARHELARRRRIVSRSLQGMWLVRTVLGPRFGRFALGLWINKVGRRLLPFWLLVLLVTSALLAFDYWWAGAMLLAQVAFYVTAALHPYVGKRLPRRLVKLSSLASFFCIGMLGTMFGVLDFLKGSKVARWDPKKQD